MENVNTKITDRLMIVRLGIHQWYPTKHDKAATQGLADLHGVDPVRLGKVIKNLVNLKSIEPLKQRCRRLRNEFHAMTAPWEDGGLRALPAEMYFDFVEMLKDGIREIEALADAYKIEYANEIERARVELNGLFNENDYPRPEQMRAMFSVDYTFKPVPNVEDVRVWGIGDQAAADIEQELRSSLEAQMVEAQAHVVNQVIERGWEFVAKVNKFSDQVHETDGKGVRMYDTALTNIRDVITLVLTGLNFTGDPELTKVAKDLKVALKGVNIPKLKTSQSTRDKSTADVEKVLNKFQGVYGS